MDASTLRGLVLITGGSGSLGTALIERGTAEGWDASFICYSRDEVKQSQLAARFPKVRCILGDVGDERTLARAMRDVDIVVHAAAYKRVPEAERETAACVQANVIGSLAVASAAQAADVEKVIAISTDKACHPINAYGQSKALMERLWMSFARQSIRTTFHLVRYGNVLASRGSVIPTLLAQVAAGLPVTLTDPTMTRFWLTLDDAVDLVIRAALLPTGETLVPACYAASMGDLFDAVVPDVEHVIVGHRDGEKQHESLLNEHESPFARPIPGGWALRSLAGPRIDALPPGFVYSSDRAPHLSVARLRVIASAMTDGVAVRTLA